jgi:hypothetical protein
MKNCACAINMQNARLKLLTLLIKYIRDHLLHRKSASERSSLGLMAIYPGLQSVVSVVCYDQLCLLRDGERNQLA